MICIKKIIGFLTCTLLTITMMGCSGLGDYSIELINGYSVIRASAEYKSIVNTNDGNWAVVPIPDSSDKVEYIVQVGHDEQRYIVAKTNINLYYIIDTKEEVQYGPLSEDEFNKKKYDLKIPLSVILKDLDEYEVNIDF